MSTESKHKMRADVVANCQASPISELLKQMLPALLIDKPIILHLARTADVERDLEALNRADFIFAQLTSEKF